MNERRRSAQFSLLPLDSAISLFFALAAPGNVQSLLFAALARSGRGGGPSADWCAGGSERRGTRMGEEARLSVRVERSATAQRAM